MESNPNTGSSNPLENAKRVLAERKNIQLTQEQIEREKQEALLQEQYDTFAKFAVELKTLTENIRNHPNVANAAARKVNDLRHGGTMAVRELKSAEATKHLFKSDSDLGPEKQTELHQERRDVFDTVFSEHMDERREAKKEEKKIDGENKKNKEELERLEKEVKILFDNEEQGKLLNNKILKEAEKLERTTSTEEYKKLSRNHWQIIGIQNVNEFIKHDRDSIVHLAEEVTKVVQNSLNELHAFFRRMKTSDDFIKLFKDTSFTVDTLDNLIPQDVTGVKASVYSYDSYNLQFEIEKILSDKISELVGEFRTLEDKYREEFKVKQGKWFSGASKIEALMKINQERSDFLHKTREYIAKEFRNIDYAITEDVIYKGGRSGWDNNLSVQFNALFSGVRNAASYNLEGVLPEYKQNFILADYLELVKDGIMITQEQRDNDKEYLRAEEELQQSRFNVELLKKVQGKNF